MHDLDALRDFTPSFLGRFGLELLDHFAPIDRISDYALEIDFRIGHSHPRSPVFEPEGILLAPATNPGKRAATYERNILGKTLWKSLGANVDNLRTQYPATGGYRGTKSTVAYPQASRGGMQGKHACQRSKGSQFQKAALTFVVHH